MANFKIAIPVLAAFEGGLSKNPKDNAANDPAPNSGGYHTNKGITWATFRDNAAQFGYEATTELFLQMPQTIANIIYKSEYWNPLKLDTINSNKKAYELFDFSVNSGPVTAILQAQKALGIAVDGVAGPDFVKHVNALSEAEFSRLITKQRITFITNSGKINTSLKSDLIERVELVSKKNFTA